MEVMIYGKENFESWVRSRDVLSFFAYVLSEFW
jgi:hypothetical protein